MLKKIISFKQRFPLVLAVDDITPEALLNTMVKEVIITSEDYQKARDVIVSNHGLKISTIMA